MNVSGELVGVRAAQYWYDAANHQEYFLKQRQILKIASINFFF